MADAPTLPPLPETWEETRATLHAYSRGVSAVPRAHALAHPKWWHVGLEIGPTGLATPPVALPAGGAFQLRMDLRKHATSLETSHGEALDFDMTAGVSGTGFADQLIAAISDLGLEGDYDRSKFENDEPRKYDPDAAETYFAALTDVVAAFRSHAHSLEGEPGPVHHWPHNFDTSVEWYGTRMVEHEEGGEAEQLPAQINLGFYPEGRPYFYSNPWPFDEALTASELPHGAEWHTEGWQGTILYYDTLVGDPAALRKVQEYAAAVHQLASPGLTA